MTTQKENKTARPPVVVIMGHIDHGKSTLLDYIRKTNIADNEAGGITQNISAYEVLHKGEDGEEKQITFLDTPGHEAFSKMRERGAQVADIAILIVSAEDGVKPQTIEAWKNIKEWKLPCVVAINKIDKPEANVEKTKQELAENEIYLENYGGDTPFVEISAKAGTGIDNLLSIILLVAEMENFTGNSAENASGLVIEANLDSKRGIRATLIIKEGSVKKGMFVVAEDAIASTRMLENYRGEAVQEVSLSSPIRVFGFDKMPAVGALFKTFDNKQEAQKYAKDWALAQETGKEATGRTQGQASAKKMIPIILKADVAGSLEAIEKEIAKIKSQGASEVESENAEFKIITSGVGPVSESDIKTVSANPDTLIVGFNVGADKSATLIAQARGLSIQFFDIIYKLTEWLEEQMEAKRPRIETTETIGRAKVLRAFSKTRERQILGGKVLEGRILLNKTVKIMRRDFEIGRGRIVNLEQSKAKTSAVEEGVEFGMMIESKIEIVAGDVLELFSIEHK